MHILTFPTNKKLRSIRDLTSNDIKMLQHCKFMTLKMIKEKYGFDESEIKIFIHYAPSTYHLHIHFYLTSNISCESSVEYSHDLDTVIFNLKI